MKHLPVLLLWFSSITAYGQLYKAESLTVSFFSETPLENINATSTKATSLLDFANDSIVVKIANTSFKFKNSLMEEHFNENYMESEKYPYSTFRGKFAPKIDPNTNGTFKVNAKGHLHIHGTSKPREIEATIIIQNGKAKVSAEFMVKPADHNIEVPKLVFNKIAESIKTSVNGSYIFAK